MMDLLGNFLALYLVDVARATEMQAVLGVALFTGVGLGGDALLVPLLERVDGLRLLRTSVGISIVVFPMLLLAPTVPLKLAVVVALALLNSGWYSIPKARLYATLPGQSATVMTLSNAFGLVGALLPAMLGAIATRVGLGPTMWILLAGPVLLFLGLPRSRDAHPPYTIDA
jgi:FSR family fosmidomycin resistance protein-like MFS transporter